MSRQRMIKPAFWVSDQVMSCSRDARLLFIGLWNFCDDRGIHTASLSKVKAEIFPMDSLNLYDISSYINELKMAELIFEYEVKGIKYWKVTGWEKHQTIRHPTFEHPIPENEFVDSIGQSSDRYRNPTVTLPHDYGNPTVTLPQDSGQIKLNKTKSNQIKVVEDTVEDQLMKFNGVIKPSYQDWKLLLPKDYLLLKEDLMKISGADDSTLSILHKKCIDPEKIRISIKNFLESYPNGEMPVSYMLSPLYSGGIFQKRKSKEEPIEEKPKTLWERGMVDIDAAFKWVDSLSEEKKKRLHDFLDDGNPGRELIADDRLIRLFISRKGEVNEL